MKPVIDVLNLNREEMPWTDSITFAGDTIVGKIAAGETPVSLRTGEKCWKIYRVNGTGEVLKPVDPATGKYYTTEFLVWDDRATYTYA